MDGNLLPFGIFVDDTPFAMIRVVVVAEALRDDNEKEVTGLINQLNLKYKPYKFYIDGAKNLMAESCVIFRDGEDAVGICSFCAESGPAGPWKGIQGHHADRLGVRAVRIKNKTDG